MEKIILIVILLVSIIVLPTIVMRVINYYGLRRAKNKILYLTFDDGPSIEYTRNLMDLLIENNVPATFFVVADFAKNNPEIIKEMKNNNFTIGLHSKSHKNQMFNFLGAKKDFDESNKIMKDLDVDIKYYRPPWGCYSILTLYYMVKNNLRSVLWSVMAEDWKGNTTSEIILSKLRHRSRPGSIICLHDARGENNAPSRTIEALNDFIPEMKEKGYIFKEIG